MSRYIFLDIDGVINTERHQLRLRRSNLPCRDDNMPFFDPEAVANLQQIVEVTEASVIITSSWRHKGMEVMEDVWYSRKMPGILEGLTPTATHSLFCTRGMEILQWLADRQEVDSRYVIIDDCVDFLPEQMPFLVRTNPYCGLSQTDAQKAVAILTSNLSAEQ